MSKLVQTRGLKLGSELLSSQRSSIPSAAQAFRCASNKAEEKPDPDGKSSQEPPRDEEAEPPKQKKTMAELDEELRMKLEGHSGEGGEAGLELEDGRPTAMKRGVRNNMFRLI
ncbi:MAG: hypothetical protein Q9201_003806 [Fulgogasparrea decipioides]